MKPLPSAEDFRAILVYAFLTICIILFFGILSLGVQKLRADAQVPIQLSRIADALEGRR